jgi:hypothetical protein
MLEGELPDVVRRSNVVERAVGRPSRNEEQNSTARRNRGSGSSARGSKKSHVDRKKLTHENDRRTQCGVGVLCEPPTSQAEPQTRCHSAVPAHRRRSCKPTSRGSTLTVEEALYKERTHGALVISPGVPCGLSAERSRHPPREAYAARAARTPWWRRGERQHSLAPQWAAGDPPRSRANSARHPVAATYVQRFRRRTVFSLRAMRHLDWDRELET